MPRKKKTDVEPGPAAELAAQELASSDTPVTGAGSDIPKVRRKSPVKATAKKPAAKERAAGTKAKRAAKSKDEDDAELDAAEVAASETPESADAEAAANAADTLEDAFDANDVHEARTATAEAGGEPHEEPKSKPAQESDEADGLKGDRESGGGEVDEKPEAPPAKQERLQKILAAAGIASRRHAEEMIVAGRVQVNGQVVMTLGSKADAARDHIRVDGKLIHGAERLRYFVLNKPRGYVTTVSDPEGRPTVMQFFERMRERLYPVGRLDYQSEGLLLMTNDGELANQLTRAASGVEKVYLVKVAGQPDEGKIEALRSGVRIDRAGQGEGKVQTAPARIRQFRQGENPWFEVGLIEGRNRELRKMFEEIGHHVEKIRRVGYGPLELDLEPGKTRELTPEEVQALRLAAEGKLKPKRIRTRDMLPREAGRTINPEADKPRGGKPFGRHQDRSERPGRPQGEGPRGVRAERVPEARNAPWRDRREGGFRPQGSGFRERPQPAEGERPRNRGQWTGNERPRQAAGAGRAADRGGFRGDRAGQRPSGERPFRGKPAFGGKPGFGKPGFGSKPGFGGKPALGGKPSFGSKPGYGSKPGFSAGPLRIEPVGGEGAGSDRGSGGSLERGPARGFGRTGGGLGRAGGRGPASDRGSGSRPPRDFGRGPQGGGAGRPFSGGGRGPGRSFDKPAGRPPRADRGAGGGRAPDFGRDRGAGGGERGGFTARPPRSGRPASGGRSGPSAGGRSPRPGQGSSRGPGSGSSFRGGPRREGGGGRPGGKGGPRPGGRGGGRFGGGKPGRGGGSRP